MLLVNILLFLVASIIICISGNLVVKNLIKIDKYFRFREFIVGFLLIGVATSFPELFVGILSSLNKISSLSFGNILGSFIVDLAFVLGVVAFVGKRVKIEAPVGSVSIFLVSALVILPMLLFLDQELSRIDGAILLSAFFFYLIVMFTRRKKFKASKYEFITKKEIYKDVVIFVIALIFLIVSARLIVYAASEITTELLVPPIVIGLVIISIGTSLPELFFETNSVLKGHSSMAIGDLLGSLAFNSTFILGVVTLIYPVQAQFSSFMVSSIFILISLLTFLIFARSGREITRKEGMFLLFIYVLFIIANILII